MGETLQTSPGLFATLACITVISTFIVTWHSPCVNLVPISTSIRIPTGNAAFGHPLYLIIYGDPISKQCTMYRVSV